MSRHQETVNHELAEQARNELSRRQDARIGQRLQAIVSCESYPMQTVAQVFGVNRRTVWQWAKRFKAEGISGLADRPGRGRRPRLSSEQEARMAEWLAQGRNSNGEPTHWTLAGLKEELHAQFGVSLSVNSVWKRVRKLGFRQKVPRPRHRQADPQAAETFKKKS